jgi:hypothetical protein
MPGYLTSMMVLLEADKWLLNLETALDKLQNPSILESTAKDLAHRARNDYLRFSYSPKPTLAPPVAVAAIDPPTKTPGSENLVGNGISQYAFAGALGPDIPAAANALALNHDWVAATMHKGSPRRAWTNARTTTFVLDALDKLPANLKIPPSDLIEYKKPFIAMMIGHLASIATHVVIQPYINEWVWTYGDATSEGQKTAFAPWPGNYRAARRPNRLKLSVQIDAAIAKGYFLRDDLHSGQSWSAYLSGESQVIEFFCANYLTAFTATYGKEPRELLCALPVQDLEKQFPDITKYPHLQNKIEHWGGWPLGTLSFAYTDLFKADSPDPATVQEVPLFNKLLDSLGKLTSTLKDFPAAAPNLNQDFFSDGYKNTRNWALDAGYDHAPFAISLIMSAVILLTATFPPFLTPQNSDPDSAWKTIEGLINISVLFNVWDATTDFSTSDAVKAENLKQWNDKGLGCETIWFDIFDNSYGAWGPPFFFFNFVLTGFSPITDGIFGQNADALSGLPRYHPRKLYVLFNDLFSPLILFPLIFNRGIPDAYRKWYVRWPLYWLVNVGMDALEELFIAKGDTSRGLQGDAIGLRIWYLRVWMLAGCVLSSALVLGVKAAVRTEDKEKDLVARDYLLMLIFPAVVVGVVVWGFQGFEGALLQTLVGVDWPSTDTNLVDDLLKIDPKTNTFSDGLGKVMPISLFAGDKLQTGKYTTPDGKEIESGYFPEADVSKLAWDAWSDAHENARKNGRMQGAGVPSYQLKQLFDSASVLAAVLAMAFVNVDSGDAKNVNKDTAKAIFKDWNLDFRTDDEWNFLMSEKVGDIGVIPAATQWLADLGTKENVSRLDVQLQMTQAFGLAPDAYDKRAA